MPKPKPPQNKPAADSFITALQLAQSWILQKPVRDRVNPKKLTVALSTIPEMWVENFYPSNIDPEKTGLDTKSEPCPLTLTMTFSDEPKNPRRLIIGNVSRKTVEEKEEPGPPQFPGGPPRTITKKIETEYRYAKLDKTALVFDIRGDKLNDLFFLNSTVQPGPNEPILQRPLR